MFLSVKSGALLSEPSNFIDLLLTKFQYTSYSSLNPVKVPLIESA